MFPTPTQRAALQKTLDEALQHVTDIENHPTKSVHGAVLGVTNATETVYLNAAGKANLGDAPPVEPSSRITWFSCTKAITTTALLILVSQGKITLDNPIATFYPEFAKIKVLNEGQEIEPETPVTLRMLLTHTAGFTYAPIVNFGTLKEKPADANAVSVTHSFLSYHPNTRFTYGMGVDWAGFILEELTGLSLGQFFKKYIFEPLGMDDTSFSRDETDPKTFKVLQRDADGYLCHTDLQQRFESYREMGGHGLCGPIEDYLKFIRLWLNKGRAPDGTQLFDTALYEQAIRNQLPEGIDFSFEEQLPHELTLPASTAPHGVTDQWGLGFAITAGKGPMGKPVGTLYWSGVTNVFYWIDLENQLGVIFGTQLFPCYDIAHHLEDVEKRVYKVVDGLD